MQIIILLVVGGIIGWLASIIMKTNAQMGIIANVVVGVIGSVVGFWIASHLGFAAGNVIVGWLIAIAGSILLIALLKLLNIFK
jgi:uncharacterized membrane protein YeaQ/YmgE (transglycosylase-associated protein family)